MTIGTAFAWILGIGVLLLAVLASGGGGAEAITTSNTLFGSIYSLAPARRWSRRRSRWRDRGDLAIGPSCSHAGPELAVVRGVPVRLLGVGFLGALAVITAESTQAVGALLLLGLIAAPAGAARELTSRPYLGMAVAGGVAIGAMWGGLALSYVIGSLPPSTAILGLPRRAYAALRGAVTE